MWPRWHFSTFVFGLNMKLPDRQRKLAAKVIKSHLWHPLI